MRGGLIAVLHTDDCIRQRGWHVLAVEREAKNVMRVRRELHLDLVDAAGTSSVTLARTIVHRSIEEGSRPARCAPACTWATASFTSVGSRPTFTMTPSAISPASSSVRGPSAAR